MPYYSFGSDASDSSVLYEYTTTNTNDINAYYHSVSYTISLQDIWDDVFGRKSLAQLEEEADWRL